MIFVSAVHVRKAKEAVFGKKIHTIKTLADASGGEGEWVYEKEHVSCVNFPPSN